MNKPIMWVVVLLVVGSAIWMLLGVTPYSKPANSGPNPECPHHWANFSVRDPRKEDSTRAIRGAYDTEGPATVLPAAGSPMAQYGFSLPNQISDIPEYHDCQRMRVVKADTVSYGSLIAVFAGDSLAYMDSTAFVKPRAVAEVFVAEPGSYEPLHIENTFSCLVLQREKTSDWKAWMVPVRRQEQCTQTFTTAQLKPAFELKVVATSPPSDLTVPPVARWDWDPKANVQYIGVRCGNQWCEVGRDVLSPSESYTATGATGSAAANTTLKGFYDEQRLAEFPVGGGIQPGENTGTVVPAAGLSAALSGGVTSYSGRWVHVANVYMRPAAGSYAQSLNFASDMAAPPSARHAKVSLCRGGSKQCRPNFPFLYFKQSCTPSSGDGEIWYAKITQPDRRPQYYCVAYRAHKGAQIPPVARWRWRVDDETIWVSCPDGCCETNADESGFTNEI